LRQVHVADFPFATVSEPSPFADFFQLRQVHVTEFPLATVSVSRSFSGFSRDTCDSSDFMVIHHYILPIFPFATVPNFMLLTFHLQPFQISCATVPISRLSTVTFCPIFPVASKVTITFDETFTPQLCVGHAFDESLRSTLEELYNGDILGIAVEDVIQVDRMYRLSDSISFQALSTLD